MTKFIDDLARQDHEREQQKRRDAAKVEEYWRQHPTGRLTGQFFQALSQSAREQCEELDRRFAGNLARKCLHVRDSDLSFRLANARYSKTLAADVSSRLWINVRLSPYVYDAMGRGYETLKVEDLSARWAPSDVAAIFVQWVIGLSDLSALPWVHQSSLPPNWRGPQP